MLAGNLLIKISTNVAELQSEFNKISKSFENTVKGMQAAMAGVAVGVVFEKWVDAVKEAEQATRQVEAVLRSTGGAAGVTMKQVNALSDSLSRMSGVDDDAIQGAQALMLTFTRVSKDVFPAAQKAALDMSVALKTDLNSATMLVGKALNDPVKGMTALTKAGVSLTAGQKAVIKSLEETGHHSEAMAMILKELQTEFGGSAAAARDTLGGAFQALSTNVENLVEQLGGPDGLRYVVEFANTAVLEMQDTLATVQKYFESGEAAANEWGKSLGEFGEIGQLAFEAVASFVRRLLNDIIELGKTIGALAIQMSEFQRGMLAKVGIKMPTGDKDEFKKFLESVRDGSQLAKEDYVGNFFKPIGEEWEKLNAKTQKNMKDMRDAAASAGKNKIKTIDVGEVETEKQRKAREKLEKQIENEKKKVDEVLASYKLGTQELSNQLNKHGESNELLKAQQEILKNEHLSVAEQNKALGELFKLEQERAAIRKQIAINKEGEELQEVLKGLQQQNVELMNTNKGQGELNVSLKAQAEIEKIIKEGKTEHLGLVNQILAVAKEQEAILREQKRLESLTKYGEMTQDLADQNEQLRLKLTGQEQLLPLLEAEKKIREVMNDKTITDNDKANLVGQIQAASQQTVAYNVALENQDRTLKAIKDSSGSVTQKIAALQTAFAQGQVNAKQYSETLQDLQNDGFKNLKKDAKEFSDTLVGGLTKMFDKGTKFKDVLKDIGKQLLVLGTKKLVEPLAERLFTGIGSKLFGGQYGINQQNPLNLPGFGNSGGGILAGGATLPTSLAEGPTIVSLLQQIVSLMGGVPIAGGGTPLGGLAFPYGPPTMTNYSQSGGGLPFGAKLAGMFGWPGKALYNNLVGAPAGALGMGSGGGLMSRLGGLPFFGMPFGDWMEQFQLGGTGWANGGAFRSPLGAGAGLLGSLIGKLPFFAYGGFLGAGQWGIAGERGPELIYGGNTGVSIMPRAMHGGFGFGGEGGSGFTPPWQQQNVFTGGRGGYTGGGMISQLDYARIMQQLMQQKYESGYAAVQRGDPNAPGWYQLQELKAQADRFATTVANNGYTGQMFSRAQFEAGAAFTEFNEAARGWGGQVVNWQAMVPQSIAGTSWTPWQGFQATPIGTNFGGGINPDMGGGLALPAGLRQASFTTSQGQPIISTGAGGVITQWASNAMGGLTGTAINGMSTAFNRMFNGGNMMTAGQQGSYLNPLIRPGGNPIAAMANIGGMPGMSPFYLDRFKQMTSGANGGNQIYPDVFSWLPGYSPRRGDLGGWNMEGFMRGADRLWERSPYLNNPNLRFGTGEVFGPFWQPQLAPDMVSGLRSGSGPATLQQIMMGQAYLQRRGLLGYAQGGRAMPDGRPILVGEDGPELLKIDRPTSISSNQSLRDMISASAGGGVIVHNYTATPTTTYREEIVGRQRHLIFEDEANSAMSRRGAFSRRLESDYGVRRTPTRRS